MTSTNDWHSLIESESHLSLDAAGQLRDLGFVVLPGPVIPGGCKQLSEAYDRAVAAADPADVHTGKSKSSTRIDDFVNRGVEFDGISIYPPLLAACCQIIGGPFKLSGMRARTLKSWRTSGAASCRRQALRQRMAVGRVHLDGRCL